MMSYVDVKVQSCRSSQRSRFLKLGVIRNFAKFTGKHLCQCLFLNKVAGKRPATLLKKRFWYRCFLVNFANFLRTPFLTEHVWWPMYLIYFSGDKKPSKEIIFSCDVWKETFEIKFENAQNYTLRRRPPLIVPSWIKSNQVDFGQKSFLNIHLSFWVVFILF